MVHRVVPSDNVRRQLSGLGGARLEGDDVSTTVDAPRRLRWSERLPALYPLAVEVHRTRRRGRWLWQDLTSTSHVARDRSDEDLAVRVIRHRSLLLRTLGESEMWLQHNKVTNLRIACAQVDGLVLRPGEEFSFCRLVGRTTRRKGYVDGMLLDNGQACAGVGGGICQLANLLHWVVLHSPLTVTERSEHSFDPFPDHGRVLPWGVGCAVYYNYVDLRFRNDTDVTFQLRVGVGERYLEGDLRASEALPFSYSVHARDEVFEQVGTQWYRHNEIWRDVIDRRTGDRVGEELLKRNRALVVYDPRTVAGCRSD